MSAEYDSPTPDLVAVMWSLRKGDRIAQCGLWRHPMGFELRCDVDGDTRQTAVQRRRETAEDQAQDWWEAFQNRGWRS